MPDTASAAQCLVEVLNELLAADPKATRELVINRTLVDAKVAKTSVLCAEAGDKVKTSALGIVNGALIKSGAAPIGMLMDEHEALVEFTLLKPRR